MKADLIPPSSRPLASKEIVDLLDILEKERGRGKCVSLTGLPGPAKAFYLLGFFQRLGIPLTVITRSDTEGEKLVADMKAVASSFNFVDPATIHFFPSLDADPYQGIAPHLSRVSGRVRAMAAMGRGECSLLVAPVEGLFTALDLPASFSARCLDLGLGDEWKEADDMGWFAAGGYERAELVGAPGEFSRRGGVVDIWPPADDLPLRVELDGHTVESIRRFDPAGQRSTEKISSCRLTPAKEIPLSGVVRARLSRALTGNGEGAARLIGFLEREGRFPGIEACARLALTESGTILDHATDHLLVIDEPEMTMQEAGNLWADLLRSYEDASSTPLPPPDKLFYSIQDVETMLRERKQLTLHHLHIAGIDEDEDVRLIELPITGPGSFRGRVQSLMSLLRRRLDQGEITCILMNTEGTRQRFRELLDEEGIGARPLPEVVSATGGNTGAVYLGAAGISSGFTLASAGWHLIAEHEIFGGKAAARPRSAAPKFDSDFRDLRVGDLVVHVDHGIGRYDGLIRVPGGKADLETMILTYHGNDRLYVPIDRLDLIHKYSGSGDKTPALDRLGGQSWTKKKKGIKKSMEEMAAELLNLYAARKTVEGHAFGKDTDWQSEFEAAFPYEMTPDQARAIEDVKKDMEGPDPMDRLLCGDVGFGKTEIALRAACKAVMGGKQVAILAPTTILAFQHMHTFRERFAPFPVSVDSVSRLRSPREAKEIIARAATGELDILIGTHRLLSKDVAFKNLGLLVVDEEQRFGVKDKERVKKFKKSVDVLTLTATPIPRTLQMSIAGVLDLSLVETPPESRLAIQTHMVPFRESIIAPAIRHELERGGQIYFVHNRVESIYSVAGLLRRLVPEARISVAHGQMGKRELEDTMMAFVRGERDILVSTTIIENGLDIPRVNTLIVNRADRFGLSQLYQLRGRIGRSDRQAYAYMLVPPERTLTPAARRRLQVLQDFTELGSGFRIAAMDLEIRGAGDLLGAKQHGHIAAVGFDMYCRMLQIAIDEMKGGETIPEFRTQINLGVDVRIPDSYIPEEGLRLSMYRRIAAARTEEEVESTMGEMEDRFGNMPMEARRLLTAAQLRLLAEKLHIQQLDLRAGFLQVKFLPSSPLDPTRLLPYVQSHTGATFSPSGLLKLPASWPPEERLDSTLAALRELG